MALYGLSVTKSTLWQGRAEEFDNTYFYEGPVAQVGDANFQRLVDRVVAAEKRCHGTAARFIRARVWSAGGTPLENETLLLVDLSGTGEGGSGPLFKEAAAVVEWECERPNILGRKVYLRKFIRPCSTFTPIAAGALTGEADFGTETRTALKEYADAVDKVGGLDMPEFHLCSPKLRKPRSADNGVVNLFFRSREFRRN